MHPVLAHLAPGPLAPLQLIPAAVAAVAYAQRVRTLERNRRRVRTARQASFYCGLVLIVVALASPLGHVSDELLAVHMTEHLLMADVGALLIVLGLTGPLIAPILRVRWIYRLRVLAHPLIAFPIWAADLFAWHVPTLYQGALHHSALHALEHGMFIACGINMWMCLFGPLPMPAWFGSFAKLAYIVAVRLSGALLGNVFVWSGTVLYPTYASGERYWHVSPQSDQVAAGAVMMVEGSILTLILFGWLFLRAAREGEERQELLELAGARGVALSEARATRAVAAGRGAQLRRRLEDGVRSGDSG